VDFINEQDDFVSRLFDFTQNGLQTIFELTAKLQPTSKVDAVRICRRIMGAWLKGRMSSMEP
jgi:hypothetical protein